MLSKMINLSFAHLHFLSRLVLNKTTGNILCHVVQEVGHSSGGLKLIQVSDPTSVEGDGLADVQ